MKPTLRVFLVFLIAVAAFVMFRQPSDAFVTTRTQIAVTVVVNVTPTPTPVAYVPTRGNGTADAWSGVGGFAARFVQFIVRPDRGFMVAVSPTQTPLRVEARVSPNPLATLLYSNTPVVQLSGMAGTSASLTCAFTISVDTTVTNWYLYNGVSDDLKPAPGMLGGLLHNNTYLTPGTPLPTATPYADYATDGSQWALLQRNTGKKTYCVDLQIAIPPNVPGGSYSTNAVYTLNY